jgi:hypothetical protein
LRATFFPNGKGNTLGQARFSPRAAHGCQAALCATLRLLAWGVFKRIFQEIVMRNSDARNAVLSALLALLMLGQSIIGMMSGRISFLRGRHSPGFVFVQAQEPLPFWITVLFCAAVGCVAAAYSIRLLRRRGKD